MHSFIGGPCGLLFILIYRYHELLNKLLLQFSALGSESPVLLVWWYHRHCLLRPNHHSQLHRYFFTLSPMNQL
jgi:hypothetical protein